MESWSKNQPKPKQPFPGLDLCERRQQPSGEILPSLRNYFRITSVRQESNLSKQGDVLVNCKS